MELSRNDEKKVRRLLGSYSNSIALKLSTIDNYLKENKTADVDAADLHDQLTELKDYMRKVDKREKVSKEETKDWFDKFNESDKKFFDMMRSLEKKFSSSNAVKDKKLELLAEKREREEEQSELAKSLKGSLVDAASTLYEKSAKGTSTLTKSILYTLAGPASPLVAALDDIFNIDKRISQVFKGAKVLGKHAKDKIDEGKARSIVNKSAEAISSKNTGKAKVAEQLDLDTDSPEVTNTPTTVTPATIPIAPVVKVANTPASVTPVTVPNSTVNTANTNNTTPTSASTLISSKVANTNISSGPSSGQINDKHTSIASAIESNNIISSIDKSSENIVSQIKSSSTDIIRNASSIDEMRANYDKDYREKQSTWQDKLLGELGKSKSPISKGLSLAGLASAAITALTKGGGKILERLLGKSLSKILKGGLGKILGGGAGKLLKLGGKAVGVAGAAYMGYDALSDLWKGSGRNKDGSHKGFLEGGLKSRASKYAQAAIAGAAIGSIIPGVGTIAGAAVGGVAAVISDYKDEIADYVKKLPGELSKTWDKAKSLVNEATNSITSFLSDGFTKSIDNALDTTKTLLTTISSTVGDFISSVGTKVEKAWDSLKGVKDYLTKTPKSTILKDTVYKAREVAASGAKKAEGVVQSAASSVSSFSDKEFGKGNILSKAADYISNKVQSVAAPIAAPVSRATSDKQVDTLIKKGESAAKEATNLAKNAASSVTTKVSKTFDIVKDGPKAIFNALSSAMSGVKGGLSKAAEWAGPVWNALKKFNITDPKEIKLFLGQVLHESGLLRYTTELASGRAYEGRKDLGNTAPGDGVKYKGRGLIQVTGKTNYARMSKDLGVDFVDNPELVSTPEYAALSAAWWWNNNKKSNKRLQKGIANDDITLVSKAVNGGTNGLSDRIKLTDAINFGSGETITDNSTNRPLKEAAIKSSAPSQVTPDPVKQAVNSIKSPTSSVQPVPIIKAVSNSPVKVASVKEPIPVMTMKDKLELERRFESKTTTASDKQVIINQRSAIGSTITVDNIPSSVVDDTLIPINTIFCIG